MKSSYRQVWTMCLNLAVLMFSSIINSHLMQLRWISDWSKELKIYTINRMMNNLRRRDSRSLRLRTRALVLWWCKQSCNPWIFSNSCKNSEPWMKKWQRIWRRLKRLTRSKGKRSSMRGISNTWSNEARTIKWIKVKKIRIRKFTISTIRCKLFKCGGNRCRRKSWMSRKRKVFPT